MSPTKKGSLNMKKRFVSLVMALCMLFAVGSAAIAETDWPNAPVQIIVGANAGGGIDTAARLIAKYMEKYLVQSFVVTNTTGGAGSIAANDVKNSKADGYKFLVAHEAILTNKISGVTDFDYDGFDCGGIPFKVYTTCLLSKQYASVPELVEAAKAEAFDLTVRYETFAKAEAFLIDHAYVIPFGFGNGGYVASRIDPFTSQFAPYGFTNERYKGSEILSEPMDTDAYFDAYDQWIEDRASQTK